MSKSAYKVISILLFGMIAVLVSACGGETSAQSAAATTDPIRVQLSWLPSVVFSPFYVAQDQGYYQAADLGVEIVSGGFDADGNFIVPIDVVTSGKADFGIVDAANLLIARENGTPVVALATIFQSHPLALVSLAENNITRPSELVGKSVDITYNSQLNYNSLLKAEQLDPASVNTLERTDLTTQSLLNGKVDVIDGWVTTEVAELLAAGEDINLIFPSEYGVDTYPLVIFTTEDMVKNQPEKVERFLQATLKGIEQVIAAPDAAATLFLTYDATRGAAVETAAVQQALPLFLPAGSQPGLMKPEVWEFTQEMLVEQGLLTSATDVTSAYTLHFLDTIYAQ
jgi:NitT/TauT family transport system substrate-binding protein